MINNKFYIVKTNIPPQHPKDIFEKMWKDSSFWVHSLYYRDDISYKDWKNKELKDYDYFLTEFNKTGENKELKQVYDNISIAEIAEIENDPNFVEWCKI